MIRHADHGHRERRPAVASSWIAAIGLVTLLAGCGGPPAGKVAPRTPSAREIEEADRASRAAEAAEQEAFARPKPQPATTR
jgi:hypothetical protein